MWSRLTGLPAASKWSSNVRTRTGKDRGFTLIEVLVAFLILSFSLAALFNLFSGSLDSVRRGEDYAQAVAVARAELARIDADGLDAAKADAGEAGDGYRWEVQYVKLPPLAEQSAEGDFEPMQVTVTVSWGRLDNKSLSLSTVRLVRR
jgi:general secretion pathway protein I